VPNKVRLVSIEGNIIVGRVYKMYNKIDNVIYFGSTTLPLTKRLGDHVYSYNKNIKMNLYDHMRITGLTNWTIKLLEAKFVDNLAELYALKQKWIDRENPNYLLNFKNAVSKDNSLNNLRESFNNFNLK